MGGEIAEADVHIERNPNFVFEIAEGSPDGRQFFADAAEKPGAEEIAGAGLLNEGLVELKPGSEGAKIFSKRIRWAGVWQQKRCIAEVRDHRGIA